MIDGRGEARATQLRLHRLRVILLAHCLSKEGRGLTVDYHRLIDVLAKKALQVVELVHVVRVHDLGVKNGGSPNGVEDVRTVEGLGDGHGVGDRELGLDVLHDRLGVSH